MRKVLEFRAKILMYVTFKVYFIIVKLEFRGKTLSLNLLEFSDRSEKTSLLYDYFLELAPETTSGNFLNCTCLAITVFI